MENKEKCSECKNEFLVERDDIFQNVIIKDTGYIFPTCSKECWDKFNKKCEELKKKKSHIIEGGKS